MKKDKKKSNWFVVSCVKPSLFSLGFCLSVVLLAQSKTIDMNSVNTSEPILTQYIQSKGASIISFDTSNIKQFWIEPSVLSRKDSFDILLSANNKQLFESVPFKIQLANVKENQDCKVEVISETTDYGFSILNTNSKVLASSIKEESFLNYSIASSVFHLEDTLNLSFSIKFNSKTEKSLSIKTIILSFQNNKNSSFLVSPGKILHTSKDLTTSAKVSDIETNTFSVTGKRTIVFSSKKIKVTTDNSLQSSVSIKNIGENPTTIYVGYAVYNQNKSLLDGKNYPYNKNCEVLNVVSLSESNNTIFVDKYSEWAKNCYLALDAKEDLSDIPNTSLNNGRIQQIQKNEDGHAEITFDKPIQTGIQEGTKVRVHGQGGGYLYTASRTLKPGEEYTFTATMKKDDSILVYSSKGFSKNAYYVVPLILSYSADPNADNTIQISNYSIEY